MQNGTPQRCVVKIKVPIILPKNWSGRRAITKEQK
jgi:hypothetical protein